ncbi:hypothetical protein H6G93_38095 [Nostoc sp. FACHB-973]|nr:hypothetical protein [Nostoc sp. FACHB-973]
MSKRRSHTSFRDEAIAFIDLGVLIEAHAVFFAGFGVGVARRRHRFDHTLTLRCNFIHAKRILKNIALLLLMAEKRVILIIFHQKA